MPPPVGFIDNTDIVSGRPEFHLLSIPGNDAPKGAHWITIIVNPDVPAGLKDDFVLKGIYPNNAIGAKIGW